MLTRLPLGAPGPPPFTLVAASGSLAGGGLFFDWTPWLAVAAGVLAVSALCWLPLARGLTRAIGRLTDATGRIAEGRFDVRVADENRRDELGALAGSINRMAARLDGFVNGQKRFLGDTAHELCAPLARLQLAAGILEQRAGPATAGHVADLLEEIGQMSALVDELLSFSRASLAGATLARQPVELRPLAARAAQREAPDDPARFDVQIPAGLRALGDADLLLRALSNLLRNAVRHAPGAGPVIISANRDPGAVRLQIRDAGPGVPADTLARLFDPFYRVDLSRDRATGGVGLGLAIVKTCVEACGGAVACRNLAPAGFEVTLNLEPADAPGAEPVPLERPS